MVTHARQFGRLEWDKATLAILLELHIGTLHLAGEHHEKRQAIDELMGVVPSRQEHQLRAHLAQMLRSNDEVLADALIETSRRLFS